MSGLIVTCYGCHREYEPSREDILGGFRVWSLCPDCRIEPPATEPGLQHIGEALGRVADQLATRSSQPEKGVDHAARDR